MKRVGATGIAVGLALVAYAFTFTYAAFRPVTVAWYAPLAREWRMAKGPGPLGDLAMDFYGRLLCGAAVGLAVGGLAYVAARRFGRDPRPGSFTPWAVTANALVFVALSAMLFGWTLSRRVVQPPPTLPFERSLEPGGTAG